MASMIQQLQGVLDRQARALEVRDSIIAEIRAEFGQLLHSLELTTNSQVATLDDQLRLELQRQAKTAHKNTEIRAEIASAQADLQQIEADSTSDLEVEVSEIDKQLELLLQRKRDLLQSIRERQERNETRRSKAQKLIGALESQLAVFDNTRLASLESQIADSRRELDASISGQALWAQVVELLGELDTQTTNADFSSALVALESAAQQLFSHIEHAKSMHWNLLVTAIGHEYAVVQQALDAVRKVSD